jgi:MFS transporter, AAHS family, 4-hydroxybenzoate transporter
MADDAHIDATHKGSPHFLRVLILCLVVAMLDGYDTQAIAFVTPVLGPNWGIDKAGFGIFALLTPLATNLTELAIWRFLTGIGLGVAIPNLIALTAEHAPGHRRALATGVMFCGFPLGALLCGLAAPSVINGLGWEWIFYLGGVLPLLFAPVLIFTLVESPVWMNREQEKATSLVPVKDLFADRYAPVTSLLWTAFFAILLVMYFIVNWMPSIFVDAGLTLEQATRTTVILNMGGIAGGLLITRLIDRFGAVKVLPLVFIMAAIAVLSIGRLEPGSIGMFTAIFVAGIGVIGIGRQCVRRVGLPHDFARKRGWLGSKLWPDRIGDRASAWRHAAGKWHRHTRFVRHYRCDRRHSCVDVCGHWKGLA